MRQCDSTQHNGKHLGSNQHVLERSSSRNTGGASTWRVSGARSRNNSRLSIFL